MPDIAMCIGIECPMKNECYRHRAIPSQRAQAFFVAAPHKDGVCEYFQPLGQWTKLSPIKDDMELSKD